MTLKLLQRAWQPLRWLMEARCCSCLQKLDPSGNPTLSAHPARFSPDDKFSRERVTLKKRFGLLPTQQPPHEM